MLANRLASPSSVEVYLAHHSGASYCLLNCWWRYGDRLIDDHRRVALPPNAQPGAYSVVVGIYDRQNGQRVIATDSAGKRYKDDGVVVGSIEFPASQNQG